MSADWKGFTIDDIVQIRSNGADGEPITRNPISKRSKKTTKKLTFKKGDKDHNMKEEISSPPPQSNDDIGDHSLNEAKSCKKIGINKEDHVEEEPLNSISIPILRSETLDRPRLLTVPVPSIESLQNGTELAVLVQFEERQKQMEQFNKNNKIALQKALEDRCKRTQEEARRLGQIEEELKKLDAILSTDVSIIRSEIEVASLEYMESQKRYDKAEKEYLDAKLQLFTHKEKKDLLTGHLCTIIEQNELRKAKKISELMRQLEMGLEISTEIEVVGPKTEETNSTESGVVEKNIELSTS